MNDKKLTIRNTPKEILEAIEKEHGIQIIKDFIKTHNKKTRKQNTKVNNYKDVAIKVYNLVMYGEYSKTKAIEKIADDNSSSTNTVRNHCAKFDKEAKEFDFYSFCAIAEKYNYKIEAYPDGVYSEYANINKVDAAVFEIYLHKYKDMPTNERKKYKVDYTKFEILQRDKQNIQKQRYYQTLGTDEIPF